MLLDSSIRDMVLLPLMALAVLVVHARNYAIRLTSPVPKPAKNEPAQRALIARSARLRANGGYISHSGFEMRRQYLGRTEKQRLLEEVQDAGMAAMGGPMQQMDMIKQQVVNMVLNMGIGMWVNAFFVGFLTLKLPFSLTERFKPVTQSGVMVPGLDTSYVSAISWYIIVQFGITPLFRLFGGKNEAVDEARMMQMQMGMMPMPGMGGPGNVWQPKTSFKAEADALAVANWSPAPLLAAEKELLEEAAALGLAGAAGAAAVSSADKKRQ